MRFPDFHRDGWCLEDGEQYHRDAPATFWIPELETRKALYPGDMAKLIFKIAVEGGTQESVERMWVIVRERLPNGYIGVLDNEPDGIARNEFFWAGAELPFEYRHIIDVEHANENSMKVATAPAPIPWQRD